MISRNLKLLIVLIGVGTVAAWVGLVVIPSQLAKRSYEAARTLGNDFKRAFNFEPEIIVDHTIVLNQKSAILELAVLSQNFEHRYSWTNTWLNSTKKISISGTFEAKVGFDLNERFSILLQDGKAIVKLPQPRILSVEAMGDIVYRDDRGVWNWISSEDRSKAANAFIQDARKYANQADFVEEAKAQMEEKLRTLLKPYADMVEIEYTVLLPGKR